jgi:excisionase family DNA binding protein
MATKKDQLLTLSQAGKRYGYSSDYLRRLAEKGRLTAQKIGHQWLTTASDIETFLESREPRGVYKKHPRRK